MGLLDIFKNSNGQFVTERKFKNNVIRQVELAPHTLIQLRNYGVSSDTELKVEFFFYSKTADNAERLSEELRKMDYDVEFGKSGGNKNLYVITGWTTKMAMDDQTVQSWTRQMCELGYKFDCDFDGWGTSPDQD